MIPWTSWLNEHCRRNSNFQHVYILLPPPDLWFRNKALPPFPWFKSESFIGAVLASTRHVIILYFLLHPVHSLPPPLPPVKSLSTCVPANFLFRPINQPASFLSTPFSPPPWPTQTLTPHFMDRRSSLRAFTVCHRSSVSLHVHSNSTESKWEDETEK